MNDKDMRRMMLHLAPNLFTELEWQFRNARDYDTRRIAGQAKAAIESLQARVKQEHQWLEDATTKITRLNAVLDDLVGECRTKSVSSRVCGRGTKCCVVYHGEYKRNRGDDNG